MLRGIDNIPQNIPTFNLNVKNILQILLVPQNNVMDLNNVMCKRLDLETLTRILTNYAQKSPWSVDIAPNAKSKLEGSG